MVDDPTNPEKPSRPAPVKPTADPVPSRETGPAVEAGGDLDMFPREAGIGPERRAGAPRAAAGGKPPVGSGRDDVPPANAPGSEASALPSAPQAAADKPPSTAPAEPLKAEVSRTGSPGAGVSAAGAATSVPD